MNSPFRDRRDAGQQLATQLRKYAGRTDLIVLALPRGGVPVGFEVAVALDAPLDVFVVRKLGLPWHDELAIGALASGGVMYLDQDLIALAGVSDEDIRRIAAMEKIELDRRERSYRGSRPFPSVAGKTAILVDDGLATGSTMRAAVGALRQEDPDRIVVAVPVASPETCEAFRDIADDVVCAVTPERFYSVGRWYRDFSQTSDEEVHELLDQARAGHEHQLAG